MQIDLDYRAMNVRTLLIVIAVAGMGLGGIFAYDAYLEYDKQSMAEQTMPSSCSNCALQKSDLQRLREENEQQRLHENQADPDEN